MISANQIREVISGFLEHGDVDRFVLEFSKVSFDIRRRGTAAAADLVKTVEAKLAEAYVGHLSVTSMRGALEDIGKPAAVGYYYLNASAFSSNSVNSPAVVEKAFPAAAGVSGTSPGVVFGLEVPAQG